jgi:hypothetical protein
MKKNQISDNLSIIYEEDVLEEEKRVHAADP